MELMYDRKKEIPGITVFVKIIPEHVNIKCSKKSIAKHRGSETHLPGYFTENMRKNCEKA
jgi:hypothetical protein